MQLYKIFHLSIFKRFRHVFFAISKITEFKIIHKKKLLYETFSFMVVFLLFFIFSFMRQSSSSFILIISYYVDIYFYISTILLSLSLVSLSSLNRLVVQCSSIKVLVHLKPAPSMTIQLLV